MQQPAVYYERNRDHRSRKRFRNLEAEKGRLNSSRARSEVPARNYKSMSNLSAIAGDDSEQAPAGSSISKFWKWLKHNPAKEAPAAATTDATSAAPMPRKSLSKQKGGFYGNLGLGEYVGAIDDDFADEDEDDTPGTGRQGLLDVITRRISSTAPPPTSLVAMFDLPGQRRVSRGEEHVEKTSFGVHEERWGIPAYILTNDLRFHPGEQFTLQLIYDYLNELRGAMQWTQTVSRLCDDQLIFERQTLRGRRLKKLSDTIAPGAHADAETELRDLRVELACFESKTAAFLQQKVSLIWLCV
ncbi:unnamed protein product [Dibothriocephalus latus]|uniref:Uncharacterized protein n=1 Tax=Dibothriocephalus latus TaxID=60516 RepID=A0A3P6TMR3_DIBLA|nr:unnamed protein product [Dibothriocephalus latus]